MLVVFTPLVETELPSHIILVSDLTRLLMGEMRESAKNIRLRKNLGAGKNTVGMEGLRAMKLDLYNPPQH